MISPAEQCRLEPLVSIVVSNKTRNNWHKALLDFAASYFGCRSQDVGDSHLYIAKPLFLEHWSANGYCSVEDLPPLVQDARLENVCPLDLVAAS